MLSLSLPCSLLAILVQPQNITYLFGLAMSSLDTKLDFWSSALSKLQAEYHHETWATGVSAYNLESENRGLIVLVPGLMGRGFDC